MARDAILDLLRTEHAALWSEAQAKIGDTRWRSVPTRIDPHHLTTARAQLIANRRIVSLTEKTRGGHEISVLHLADTRGISTAIEKAAARKRSLAATFNSWIRPRSGYPIGWPTASVV